MVAERNLVKPTKTNMVYIILLLYLLAAAGLFAAERYGALKYLLLMSGMFVFTGCLSFYDDGKVGTHGAGCNRNPH
jgi:hypothetical protein